MWNLDRIFSDKSHSPGLEQEMKALQKEIPLLQADIQSLSLEPLVEKLQKIEARCMEVENFIHCLLAQDVHDTKAIQLRGEISSLKAALETAFAVFDQRLLKEESANLQPLAFYLDERKKNAKEKLPLTQESLINDLSVDGYHGWSELYQSLVGKMTIPFEGKSLSAGQAANRLTDPQRSIRTALFESWENSWQSEEQLFSQTLNHLGGFRLKIYEHRKWDILKEPLLYNRMERETLDAMWKAVHRNLDMFKAYFAKKAALLGIPRLSWTDLEAPLFDAPFLDIPFEKAMSMIIECFEKLSPKMARFAKKAYQDQWIEAEDRPGKQPGGFCIHFPIAKESRIFMTYSNTIDNLSTLAHELGHAYHNHAVEHLPFFLQGYRMNVAETASTLAEVMMNDYLINNASSRQEKCFLLENRIQNAMTFLMNIRARFLFELEFYQQRKKAPLLPQELNLLMVDAQKTAFLDLLDEMHPHFWASKMHFFFTDVPFYNFPYTFGYLFSMGLYHRLQKDKAHFAAKIDALLEDSGRYTVEDLAKKHLDTDLTRPDFWEEGIACIARDIDEFLKIS